MMFTSIACRFALFFFVSLPADAAKGSLRVLDQSESVADPNELLIGRFDIGPASQEDRFVINYVDFGTKTLAPGVYDAAGNMGLTGELLLEGGEGDEWSIYIGGTFTTLAGSKITFSGTGKGTVHWVVTAAVTIGTNSQMVGDIATGAAMTVGACDETHPSFVFDYDATLTIGGTLTFAAGSYMPPIATGASVNWVVTGAITFGAASIASGDMETTAGAITLGANAKSGNLKAYAALTLGFNATTGTLQAGGAITSGSPYDLIDYDACFVGADCPLAIGGPCFTGSSFKEVEDVALNSNVDRGALCISGYCCVTHSELKEAFPSNADPNNITITCSEELAELALCL
jgi:hypothetical protein